MTGGTERVRNMKAPNRAPNALAASDGFRYGSSAWRVGGVVTQRIANPAGATVFPRFPAPKIPGHVRNEA
jgi:hypothetical protein